MSVLDVLPPSPPTTNHRNRISHAEHLGPFMSTPDDSPASFPPSSGTTNRKKVGFVPASSPAAVLSSSPSIEMSTLKPLPPSRDCPKNAKSILKPYIDPTSTSITMFDGQCDAPIASSEMLESIAQQLSNNNKSSSIDAYQNLSQIIKSYDEIPEDVNTRSCIASILKSIKRDLSTHEQTQSSPIDTNLMTQALKVAVILVWSEHLSPLLADDFRVFIMDRSISVITEHTAPKVIIIHYMHLLAMQNFRPSIFTKSSNRAVKLLEALQEVTNHVQGKGAISERLLIYQRLIDQVRPTMKQQAGLWIREVFQGMSASVKDIRDKAMSVGTRACAAFPASPAIAEAAKEALASTISDKGGNDRTLNTAFTQRLEKMVAAKDEAVQVPQIWALCMLLCNSNDTRLDSWTMLRDWLRVIQRCFNCSDTNVRSQAFLAWNRLIHISKPHEASETMVSILLKPMISQMDRASVSLGGKGLRPATVSSYCMLLYHAFRPAASHKQYDKMWNEYIVKVMGNSFLAKSPANSDLCCRIIMSLTWRDHTTSRVWNENRAHDNAFVEPEELPTIDCKWIRSRCEHLLQIFQLLFKHSAWGPSIQNSKSAYVVRAWTHFLTALRESASKEIKSSADTKKAISHIVDFMDELPHLFSGNCNFDVQQGRSRLICSAVIDELGSVPLIEAMEANMKLRPAHVIYQLLKENAAIDPSLGEDVEQPRAEAIPAPLVHYLQRCLKLLDAELSSAYVEYDSDSPRLRILMEATIMVMKYLPLSMMKTFMTLMQSCLDKMFRDDEKRASALPKTADLLIAWNKLSVTIIELVQPLQPDDYIQYDAILASVLLSSNDFTRTALLRHWNASSWNEMNQHFGPKLTEAVKETYEIVKANVPRIFDDSDCEIQDDQDTSLSDVENPSLPRLNRNEAVSEESVFYQSAVPQLHKNILGDHTVGLENVINFVKYSNLHTDIDLIESSPLITSNTESQCVIVQQRNINGKQHKEPGVATSDLTSNVQPLYNPGQQLPSSTFDLARKAAAMQDIPTTPDFVNEQDPMENSDLPTPTPQRRRNRNDAADIEVNCSPLLPIGRLKQNVGALDVLSSPPKPPQDDEITVIDLDGPNIIDGISTPAEIEFVNSGARINDPRLHRSSQTTGADNLDSNTASSLASVVLETVQTNQKQDYDGADPRPEDDLNTCSDEMDELSASQLSQNLDWHIEEEARQSRSMEDPEKSTADLRRRRKRTPTGYADQDNKKRRKRASYQKDVSIPSVVSHDFGLGQANMETDEIWAAKHSQQSSPNRRQQSSFKTGDLDPKLKSSETRPQSKHRQVDRIPLHLRSPNSQTKEDVSYRTATQNTSTDESTEVEEIGVDENGNTKHRKEFLLKDTVIIEHGNTQALTHTANRALGSEPVELVQKDSPTTIIMTALQTALEEMKRIGKDQQASIDLKAIDDLCFNIRYQAQELVREREKV